MYVCLWSYVHFAAKITHDYMYCVHTAAAVTENVSCVCVRRGGGAKQRHPLKKRISDKAIDIHVALAQHLYYMCMYMYMYGSLPLPPATP